MLSSVRNGPTGQSLTQRNAWCWHFYLGSSCRHQLVTTGEPEASLSFFFSLYQERKGEKFRQKTYKPTFMRQINISQGEVPFQRKLLIGNWSLIKN